MWVSNLLIKNHSLSPVLSCHTAQSAQASERLHRLAAHLERSSTTVRSVLSLSVPFSAAFC